MRALVIVAIVIGSAGVSDAHGMRTAYLDVTETDTGVLATLRTTVSDPHVVPRFPAGCTAVREESAAARVRSYVFACDAPLRGQAIGVDGLGAIVTEAVVHAELRDGTVATRVVTGDAPALALDNRSGWEVARDYLWLGIVHIATGPDHLLFLLGLVLLVRRPRAVLAAETAFTVSHSLAFAATALGWIHVSGRAAEACIALSLVLLALDIGRDAAPRRAPLLALVFGLVHGLGFAGGLRELGVPDGAAAEALISFGAGVELGQIAFLAIALGALHLFRRHAASAITAGGYVVGVTGVFWMFQRLV